MQKKKKAKRGANSGEGTCLDQFPSKVTPVQAPCFEGKSAELPRGFRPFVGRESISTFRKRPFHLPSRHLAMEPSKEISPAMEHNPNQDPET